jgi:uncharacterized protein
MKTKVIKDAVHKYIELEEPFWKTVNTAEFQRLRWIEQTSYRALYPAARHDRFIHSLGVFHLGQKAFASLLQNAEDTEKGILATNKDSFLLACLLHDVGHAPFSHTCEDFFDYKISQQCITKGIGKELMDAIQASNMLSEEKATFKADFTNCLDRGSNATKPPAHHEIVSSIIVANMYPACCKHFGARELSLDLVVRCIIGCTYTTYKTDVAEVKQKRGIKDCLIRLLNSATSDVDKLDYLARDAQMSGYDNVAIDTNRLVKGLCYVIDEDGQYHPAFKKSALSIVENVIAAKNSVAKWILNHPTIIYEGILLRRSIGVALKQAANKISQEKNAEASNGTDDFIKSVFSTQSLSVNIAQGYPVRLLTDGDILYFIKQAQSRDIDEFLNRSERRHPVWKSVEEYVHLCGSRDNARRIADYLRPLVNASETVDISSPVFLDGSFQQSALSHTNKDILGTLQEFFTQNGKSMDLLFGEARSTFSVTIDPEKIYIRFSGEKDFSTYKHLCNAISDQTGGVSGFAFFYMFTKETIDAKKFVDWLLTKIPLTRN